MADNNDKASFMNSLAAKLAGGPPKKPVGLVRQTDAAAEREQAAREALQNSEDAQKRLGDVLAATGNQAAAAAAAAAQAAETVTGTESSETTAPKTE